MAKVTTKLQVTIPKTLAESYAIKAGDEIDWRAAGKVILVIPRQAAGAGLSVEERLRLFDQASDRQRTRELGSPPATQDRGWRRDELYERGHS